MISKRESEMQLGNQQKSLEFVNQSIDKYKASLALKEQELRDQKSKMTTLQQDLMKQLDVAVAQKDQQRIEYISAIDKQKEEIATLNARLMQQG